ncbi:uncharacterized protein LOC132746016 [Ruditapes philippinarum]|uniref:uncharacterized protein LOC132746016 n=1 Tax=Ruditapes philippinarum TaxID=129788 RepID=UPI00295B89A8|nr:uncharacterized protein LOC132746016 [Ruditapes philippinarum]
MLTRELFQVASVSRLNILTGPLSKEGYNGFRLPHNRLLHSVCRTGCSDSKPRYTTQTELKSLNSFKHIRVYSSENRQTALSVMKDLKHLKSSPFPALVLGGAGLIPFIAAPLYMATTGGFVASLAYSQVAYGAVILSFVGAVRWGMALSDNGVVRPNWINLGYSVTPSLIAWAALMMPTPFSLATLMFGLGGAAYMDITMYGYPSWFKAMRFLLTITAILSLWTTLLFHYVKFGSAKNKKFEVKKGKEVKQSTRDVEKAVAQAVSEIDPVADVVLGDSEQGRRTWRIDAKEKGNVSKENRNNNSELGVLQAVSEIDPVADVVLGGYRSGQNYKAGTRTDQNVKGNSEVAVMQAVSEIDPVADLVLGGNKTSDVRSRSK